MGNIRDRPCTLVQCGDVEIRAANDPSVFTITEKAPTRPLPGPSPTSAFTFKTLLRHYAKQAPKHSK